MFDPAVFISLQQKIDEDAAVREVRAASPNLCPGDSS